MRDFTCPRCGQHLTFEKSRCRSRGSAVGYSYSERTLLVIAHGTDSAHAGAVDDSQYQLCANRFAAKCNWLVKTDKGATADI